jgi:hypothetical protein
LRPEVAAGTVWLVQVDPPLVVVSAEPPGPAERFPTAKQLVAETHVIPLGITPAGTVWAVQAVPPLVVASMIPMLVDPDWPCPTAKHSVVEAQVMPVMRLEVGSVWLVQVVPPSVVASTEFPRT